MSSDSMLIFGSGGTGSIEFDGHMDFEHIDEEIHNRYVAEKMKEQTGRLRSAAQSLIDLDYFSDEDPDVPIFKVEKQHVPRDGIDHRPKTWFDDNGLGRAAFILTLVGLSDEDNNQFSAEMQPGARPYVERTDDFQSVFRFHRVGFFTVARNIGITWNHIADKTAGIGLVLEWARIHESSFMGRQEIGLSHVERSISDLYFAQQAA